MSPKLQAHDNSSGLGILYGVGVGPGDPELMTLKGQQILGDVAAVFAPKSKSDGDSLALKIVEQYVGKGSQVSELIFPMTSDSDELDKAWTRAADAVLKILRAGNDAAFITLGDPSTYSTFSYLVRAVHRQEADVEARVIPGVTSFAAAAAETAQPLVEGSDALKVLPLVTEADLDRLEDETGAVVFLKAGRRTAKILEALRRTGRIDSATVARRLGMEGESVLSANAFEQRKETGDEYLTIVLSPAPVVETVTDAKGSKRGMVHFIGAGPGAPDLITMRGATVLSESPVVIYAGSLVNPEILKHASPDADVYNSASMDLEEIIEVMVNTTKEGNDIARVHTGDPALYGAIQEQISELKQRDIEYKIVPGVTSLFAAAATLGRELTQPELAQTVIVSRIEGRTPVPGTESLASLAAHQASLALYLSVGSIERVVGELAAGYPMDTPAAVVYRASWPDEKIVEGTLADIAHKVKVAGITKTALILVGRFLQAEGRKSKLYDPAFTHEYRDGKRSSATDEVAETPVVTEPTTAEVAVAALTEKGVEAAVKVADALRSMGRSASVYAPASRHDRDDVEHLAGTSDLPLLLKEHQALVAVMALGVVIRTVGPELRDKRTDGAVIVADEALANVISVAGGHIGGANQLTTELAEAIGANPVITTASDTRDVPAVDLVLRDLGLTVDDHTSLTTLAADLLAGKPLDIYTDRPVDAGLLLDALDPSVSNIAPLPEHAGDQLAEETDNNSADILVTDSTWHMGTPERTVVRPRSIVAGVGCKKGATRSEVLTAIRDCFAEAEVSVGSLSMISSIDIKSDEPGILEAARELGVDTEFVTSADIESVSDKFTASEAVMERVGVGGVAEPSALLVSSGELIVGKTIYGPVTVALARRPDGQGVI